MSNASPVLWRQSNFVKVLAGETVSDTGSRIGGLALPLAAALTLQATPAQMAALRAAEYLPRVLVGLVAGVWIDRVRRRPVLIVSNLVRAALLVLVAIAAALGLLRLELLLVVGIALAALEMLFSTTLAAYLPTLVPRRLLLQANSARATSDAATEVGGQTAAGVLIQVLGVPLAVGIDGASFLASALGIALVRAPEPTPPPRAERRRLDAELREGMRTLVGQPILRAFLATAGSAKIANFGIGLCRMKAAYCSTTAATLGRLAIDGNLLRPDQCRPARLAFLIRRTIGGHLGFAERPEDAGRQDPLHEQVLVQDHLLARWRPQPLEEAPGLAEFGPLGGPGYGLHVGDSRDLVGVPRRPVKPQRRAPIVHDQDHVAGELERLEPRIEIARVLLERIRPVARSARLPHPDQVRRQAPAQPRHMRNDVPPQIRRGGVAMQEHDRRALSRVDVAHLRIPHGHTLARMRIVGADHQRRRVTTLAVAHSRSSASASGSGRTACRSHHRSPDTPPTAAAPVRGHSAAHCRRSPR